ncbi:hypothetical protein [Flavobacterium sp. J27]|uniref:hypothetical protein n=1 Tax=Flavobacterium sp. J27 TaxID=2060419 RepID=UPI0010304D68|nr:hypothetical protein [Flavobacterium sp. J27]
MSKEAFLLSKTFIDSSELENSIEQIANKLHFNYQNKKNDRFNEHVVNNPRTSETLEVFISDYKQFIASQNPPYSFIPGSGNGYVIVIGYGWGNKDEQVLIPFVRELMKEFPELILYAEEWIPTQFFPYLQFSLDDLLVYEGTSSDNFLFNIPYQKELEKQKNK